METSSIVLDKGKESFELNKYIVCQKCGSLVSTENGRIRNETTKIRNDEVYGSLMSSSLDAGFKYHMDNKCYRSCVQRKTLERIKISFCQPLGSCPCEKFYVR